ncbi:MAG: hypothetical protein RL340_456 [Gemmatimonadota bacterium]
MSAVTRPLTIITGPTGAGKSALALALAETHGALLVSADSRQIYRGFDVGTAKPTAAERARVTHAGVDVADPTERWSAGRWAREAAGWLADAEASGRPAIVCGGTGLWLRALVTPLAPVPDLPEGRRAVLATALSAMPTEELRRWVAALDPARAALGRAQLLRATEIALLTGTRHGDALATAAPARRAARWLVVDPGPALDDRLATRLHRMVADGWEAEVRDLLHSVPSDAPAWNACGYREVREVVAAGRSIDGVVERVRIATRQYAKRQRTWLRHQLAGEAVTRVETVGVAARDAAFRWYEEGGR